MFDVRERVSLTSHDLLNGGQSDVMISEEHRISIVLNKKGKGKADKEPVVCKADNGIRGALSEQDTSSVT